MNPNLPRLHLYLLVLVVVLQFSTFLDLQSLPYVLPYLEGLSAGVIILQVDLVVFLLLKRYELDFLHVLLSQDSQIVFCHLYFFLDGLEF